MSTPLLSTPHVSTSLLSTPHVSISYQEECQDYGAILRAQIQEKQQREFELLVELEREEEEKKKLLELENQKVQQIISNFWTPSVHTSSSPAT